MWIFFLSCWIFLYVFLDRSVTWTATETRNVLRKLQTVNGNGSRWQTKTQGRGKNIICINYIDVWNTEISEWSNNVYFTVWGDSSNVTIKKINEHATMKNKFLRETSYYCTHRCKIYVINIMNTLVLQIP